MNGTLYVLVIDAEDANLIPGHSFEVAGENMSFYCVLSIEVRSEDDDWY